MKRLIYMALMAISCSFVACNSDSGGEIGATVLTTFSDVQYPTSVEADESIQVKANLANEYGIYSAWVAYYIDDEKDNVLIVTPQLYNGAKTAAFSARIPVQKAGTKKVTFQIAASNMYGSFAASDIFTCSIIDPE